MDEGIVPLAAKLCKIDKDAKTSKIINNSPYETTNVDSLNRIVNILLLFKTELLRLVVEGKLYHTFMPGPKAKKYGLPADKRITVAGKESEQERPVIYSMVHCTSKGKTQSKMQYMKVVTTMHDYTASYSLVTRPGLQRTKRPTK